MTPKFFIGIDPGKLGGVARLAPLEVGALRMRAAGLRGRSGRDLWISWFVCPYPATVAVIERPNLGFPGTSKSSLAKLWGSFTELRAFLVAANIAYHEITARQWQKYLGIPPKKKGVPTGKVDETYRDFKKRLRAHAQKLFPEMKVTLQTADALLIAEYARRKYG